MKILYLSVVCSENKFNKLFQNSKKKPGVASQKFNSLFTKGLALNDCEVYCLSSLLINRTIDGKLWWKSTSEDFNNIHFHYLAFINAPIIRQIFLFIGSFFHALSWSLKRDNSNSIIICDSLNFTLSLSSIIVGKLTNKTVIGIVTDIPGILGSGNKFYSLRRVFDYFHRRIISFFDLLILLTDEMNNIINKKEKPSHIMEGMVDSEPATLTYKERREGDVKRILYSGGIFEQYGIRKLVDAFTSIDRSDIELHIYGLGDLENEMLEFMKLDSRIHYHGNVSNSLILKAQSESTLLINPRPTNEEFTKYSFPSKNLEYMSSGTATVTTKLPGIPEEYFNYVYLVHDESIEGFQKTLLDILSKPFDELKEKGQKARNYVMSEKNNIKQVRNVLDFIKNHGTI